MIFLLFYGCFIYRNKFCFSQMPSHIIQKHKHELIVLSDCNPATFKAIVNSDKEIIECLLEIIDNVANIRIELDDDTLKKLQKNYNFLEKVVFAKNTTVAKNLLLSNPRAVQLAVKAALIVINPDHD